MCALSAECASAFQCSLVLKRFIRQVQESQGREMNHAVTTISKFHSPVHQSKKNPHQLNFRFLYTLIVIHYPRRLDYVKAFIWENSPASTAEVIALQCLFKHWRLPN